MARPDDSTLDSVDLLAIEERASQLLDKADAWDRFPVPIDDLLAAANVKVAKHSMFDLVNVMAYLKQKAAPALGALDTIKSAISKVWGVYDAGDGLIHVDETVVEARQNFLKLHETGHHDIPAHKRLFRFFQDCEKTLAPEIADRFEREANNFARYALFKGDIYRQFAADCAFEIRTPIKLAKKFGASVYASAREFARTNGRACAVIILEPVEFVQGHGFRAEVRRIEHSPRFLHEFGQLSDAAVTPSHPLGRLVPLGRKMTKPTTFSFSDRNGTAYECIGEAFDTTYNILILIYPVRALTTTTIIMPK